MLEAARLAAMTALLAGVVGCGSDEGPPIAINVGAHWNDDPGTTGEIGYELWVDFGWPDRSKTCFPRPRDLTVTVDDRDFVPDPRGDCEWDMLLVVTGVATDRPVDVRVSSGSHVYGEAIYDNLFPGLGATLLPAGDGTIHAGGQATVQLPSTETVIDPRYGWGQFHWLDTPAASVPFYTFVPGTATPDGTTIQLDTPSLTGRASVVIKGVGFADGSTPVPSLVAATCTGFTSCIADPDIRTAGPVLVNVVP
jgi:hypothetical protein